MDGDTQPTKINPTATIHSYQKHSYRHGTDQNHPRVSLDPVIIVFDPTDLTFSPPTQKTFLSQTSTRAQSSSTGAQSDTKMADSDNESGGHTPREQDRFLPIANVSRIMKKALPANAKISKDAKETVQECVSEFISFITGEASDKCQREKRKTINGDDLLWAMTTLGFEEYVEPLKIYLQRFRDLEGEKSAMVGRGEKENGSVVNMGGSGGGYDGMYMMGQGGPVYGGYGASGKVVTGYGVGPGPGGAGGSGRR